MIKKDRMFYRFSAYGFLKNLRFFEPFIILIFRANGLSFFQIGLLYSVRDLTNNLMEIPTGVLADAFGRRRAMVLAFSAYLVSFSIFYLFDDFYIYALAMVFFGLGEAFRSGTHKALILEYLKRHDMLDLKVSYYGRTRGASQLGSAFNSLIAAGLLLITGDYRTMFLAATIPYVIDLLNLATYPKFLDGKLVALEKGAFWGQAKATFKDFKDIFSDVYAMRSIFNSASFTALFKITKDYLQPILETFALALPVLLFVDDVERSGMVIGVVYFFIYLLTSYASRNSDIASRRFRNLARAINISFLVGVGFLFLAGLATWLNLVIVSILVFLGFYVLQNLRKPMNVANISDQISQRVMASGLSIEAQFTTILVAIFAPILGALADVFGVGLALTVLGAGTLLLYSFVRVQERPLS
ncbi:MAG: MFS transporter [Anaerolineales bacterium]|nr:MFS transporter [Chloroflexota bacterium]MBL6981875.1 MFS transporter [Anaerolineales bacterium]